MDNLPLVSIVVLCRNEEEFIGRCLDSLLANDYPKDRLEVFVADGMSQDGTRG
ncbi:MAG: glycosyltransferase, partial [Acidobacteriia bacterium]|nr:glycosyltransferase [Terriglobia bacterium]